MSCSVNLQTANFAEQPMPLSFETFVEEKGIPISVFADLKSNPHKKKRYKNPKLIRQILSEREKILASIRRLQEEYARYLDRITEKKIRWLKTEYNMWRAKKDMEFFINNEKRKIASQILKIRSHLSDEDAKKLYSMAGYIENNIERDGKYKMDFLSTDAIEMANTEAVADVMKYVKPHVEQITKCSKDSFDNLLYNIKRDKYK